MTWPTLLTAGVLCFVTFTAGGGLRLASMTTVEITLTIASGALVAGAILLAPADRSPIAKHAHGRWPVRLLFAFAALTAISVAWSVQPDDSWQDAGRMLAYCSVFGASTALVRMAPGRWPALLGGVTLAAVVVCCYALLTKVFPGSLDPRDSYARLQEPYGYWNAIGLTAAMGVIGCLWLGARRAGHGLLSALAYPAMGLLLVTLMLAYSRGAVAALALGLALWLCIVPLRVRGAAALLTGAFGAGLVVAWAFSQHALTADNVALSSRTSAGHQLGALLAAMLVVLTLAGLAVGFLTARRAPALTTRRAAGATLLTLLAVGAIAFAGALAASHRGLAGSISHGVSSLTDPHARLPPNTPSRLTAIGSVRARYWNEALKIFQAHPALGAGAAGYGTARLRYRTETINVKHAHGYIVQTLADLGLVGLAITLALLAAWLAAAGRPTHPFNRSWTSWSTLRGIRSGERPGWRRAPAPYTPERIGMLSLLCLVAVFGIHSFVDWTWYVPGNACVALLCAGWLAGRGPLPADRSSPGDSPSAGLGAAAGSLAADEHASLVANPPAGQPRAADTDDRWPRLRMPGPSQRDLRSAGIAAAVVLGALLAAWTQWQPQHSVDASEEAAALLAHNPSGAISAARSAVASDPLSVQALFTLAAVQRSTGQIALARATLQRSVHLQPSNFQTWLALGDYDLARSPRAALNELRAAVFLDPESITGEDTESIAIRNAYVQALRASTPHAATVHKRPTTPAASARRRRKITPAAGARHRRTTTRRAGALPKRRNTRAATHLGKRVP